MEQKLQTTAEQIINKLDKDCVKPIARWRFVMRNNSFWALWGLSVVVGSCAIAATVFVFLNSGWRYHNITHDSLLQFLLDILPLFWIVSFGLMIFFGYYNIRHTNRGYRFSFYLVVLSSVVASVVGGTLLYTLGVAGDIDGLRKPLPFSNPIIFIEEGRWNNSSRGLISGVVQSFNNSKEVLVIRDFNNKDISISTRELNEIDISYLTKGSHIRVIGGFDISSDFFVACVVLPWQVQNVPMLMHENLERKINKDRMNICKDVRPYQRYKEIFITN